MQSKLFSEINLNLIEVKLGLPKIIILVLVGDLAYIYDMWIVNPFDLSLYNIFKRQNPRAHTLEDLVRVDEKKREDQRG